MFLQDFAIEADIGIHAFEKTGPQRILVSVEMAVDAVDTLDAAASDDIGAVLDYDFLRREIRDLVTGRRFNLQETLCREIVELLARRTRVAEAVVSVRKPDVYPDCAAVGVRMSYRRS